MRKPGWLSQEAFADFIRTHGAFRCVTCGTTDDSPNIVTIDHKVPRSKGGTHDPSNLQWMCRRCNSAKLNKDDRYWARSLYFDATPNLDCLRYAQRELCYNQILSYGDWFCQPFSQIAGHLYLLAWVVGAGKTIAIAVLGFALNRLIRERCPDRAVPRVDRILVLCKEQAVRDQLGMSLRDDLGKFGVHLVAPRVRIIKEGFEWSEPNVLDSQDIVVACVQQLWEKNGQPRKDLAEILAHFSLIVIDEPHWAFEQAQRIVREATQSLVFGTTASPIEASGELLDQLVCFSVADWDTSNEFDMSMKYVSDEDFPRFVTVVDTMHTDLIRSGCMTTTDSIEDPNYHQNLVPAANVAMSVVQYVAECDAVVDISMFPHKPAKHREGRDTVANLTYSVHALIRVESIRVGETITQALNDWFENHRRHYPRERGYRAELVCSNPSEQNGARRLDPATHPWVLAKNTEHPPAGWARFLVVVDMAREGVDNPKCGVVGVACDVGSVVEGVQRFVGRQIRSVIDRSVNPIRVTPAQLDTIHIVTHASYAHTSGTIKEALSFVMNMRSKLDDLPTVDDLLAGNDRPRLDAFSSESSLTLAERTDIACEIGRSQLQSATLDQEELVHRFNPTGSPKRTERILDWIDTVQTNPEAVNKSFRHRTQLQQITVVMRELPKTEPTLEQLYDFIKRGRDTAHLADKMKEDHDFQHICRLLYRQHAESFYVEDFKPYTDIDAQRKKIGGEVIRSLGKWYREGVHRNAIWNLVGRAVKETFGVPNEPIKKSGRFDLPQFHAILDRSGVRRDIIGFVCYALASKGLLPEYAKACRIDTDEADAAE